VYFGTAFEVKSVEIDVSIDAVRFPELILDFLARYPKKDLWFLF